MRTIDRYVLLQVLRPLGLALVIALAVFLIERMLRLLDLVLGAEGPLRVVFEIVAYLVPHYLAIALPVSLLLGVMLAFSRLGREGEIDAVYSAGIGLQRLVRPALLIGGGVTLLAFAIFGYLKPYGRYAHEAMLHEITSSAIQAFIRSGVFTRFGELTFMVEGIRADGKTFDRVFTYETKPDGTTVVIGTVNGSLARDLAGGPPILRLFDGVRLELLPQVDGASPDAPRRLRVLSFRELQTSLGPETIDMFRGRGQHEREYTLTELWKRRNTPPPGVRVSDMLAEFHERIVRILIVPFLPLLGVALALGRRRGDRFSGIAVGILALVIFSNVLDFGKNAAETGEVSPLVGLWLPWAAFVGTILVVFVRAAEGVPRDAGSWWIRSTARLIRLPTSRPQGSEG